ncbi:MAG: (d)CMP kinase [Clostridia bacterium]|nr:(d)CMP kinase [Clostridia bacterium]
MEFKKLRVAVDGPSGAGKSTVAKGVAAKTGFVYVDTGALYRTVGLYMAEHGIAADDGDGIVAALPNVEIKLAYENGEQIIRLGNEPVGAKIRTEEASYYASAVSKLPPVREFLLEMQRSLARQGGVIMDGRDIGTVIMPDAEVKIFLTATPETRAQRRYREQRQKGIDVTYEEVLEAIIARDKQDSEREIAPLKPAPDSVVFYNDEYDIGECVAFVVGAMNQAALDRKTV